MPYTKCFNEIFPTQILDPNESVLVMYPKTEAIDFSLVDSYMAAAKIIIDSVELNNLCASDDTLAMPVLNLYVNALEFALKYTIEILEAHHCAKKCNSLNEPIESGPINHSLSKLAKKLDSMLIKDPSKLHQLNNQEKIIAFLIALEEFGIHSESTRYYGDISGTLLPLHQKQNYIKLDDLHKIVSQICFDLTTLVHGSEFEFCERNEFSRPRRKELETALYYLKTKESLFKPFSSLSQANKIGDESCNTITINELIQHSLKSIPIYSNFITQLATLTKKEKAFITMGLCFGGGPIYVGNIAHFENWQMPQLNMKIYNKAPNYYKAIKELEEHLNYLNENYKTK